MLWVKRFLEPRGCLALLTNLRRRGAHQQARSDERRKWRGAFKFGARALEGRRWAGCAAPLIAAPNALSRNPPERWKPCDYCSAAVHVLGFPAFR